MTGGQFTTIIAAPGVDEADFHAAGAYQERRAARRQLKVGAGGARREAHGGVPLAAVLLEAQRQARHRRLGLRDGGLWGRGGEQRAGAHE